MPKAALNALIAAYQSQIDWLLVQAEEFETGVREVSGRVGSNEVDISAHFSTEYQHRG